MWCGQGSSGGGLAYAGFGAWPVEANVCFHSDIHREGTTRLPPVTTAVESTQTPPCLPL